LGFPAIAGKITHLDRSAFGFGGHHLNHTDHLSILQDGSYTNNTFAFSIFTVNPAALIMMAACVDWFSHAHAGGFSTSSGSSKNARRNMAAKMTQSQLVRELAETVATSGKVAKAFVENYAAIAVRETKKSGVFVLPGVGRLVRVDRKARMGRNPATGAAIKIPAKKVVKFRVAKSVKDAIVPPKKK